MKNTYSEFSRSDTGFPFPLGFLPPAELFCLHSLEVSVSVSAWGFLCFLCICYHLTPRVVRFSCFKHTENALQHYGGGRSGSPASHLWMQLPTVKVFPQILMNLPFLRTTWALYPLCRLNRWRHYKAKQKRVNRPPKEDTVKPLLKHHSLGRLPALHDHFYRQLFCTIFPFFMSLCADHHVTSLCW